MPSAIVTTVPHRPFLSILSFSLALINSSSRKLSDTYDQANQEYYIIDGFGKYLHHSFRIAAGH